MELKPDNKLFLQMKFHKRELVTVEIHLLQKC